MERFRLDGRVALVTGGGQGIGRAFAHALGEAGAAVAVVDMRLDLAEEVADELAQKNVRSMAVKADVTKPDDVQAMVERHRRHAGAASPSASTTPASASGSMPRTWPTATGCT